MNMPRELASGNEGFDFGEGHEAGGAFLEFANVLLT